MRGNVVQKERNGLSYAVTATPPCYVIDVTTR